MAYISKYCGLTPVLPIGLLIGLAYSLPVHANGANAGCYAKGYLVFDRAHRDPNGLYFVFYGKAPGLSNPVRVELPYSPTSSGGIKCRDEKVTIALRGNPRKTNDGSEYDIYYIEISTSNPPAIIKSVKNHVERWTAGGTKQVLVSVNASSAPVRLLPQAAFRFGGVSDDKDVLLPLHSDDLHHDYILEKRLKEVVESACSYDITDSIVQKDKNGRVLRRLILDKSKRARCGGM